MHLSHPWSDCPVAAGDAANIIGGVRSTDESGRQHVYLDHKQGMIIMHPDVLLSGGHFCTGGSLFALFRKTHQCATDIILKGVPFDTC